MRITRNAGSPGSLTALGAVILAAWAKSASWPGTHHMGAWGGRVIFALLVTVGCASAPVPLSETTIAALRNYHDEMERLVNTGQMSPEQAQERFYARLLEVEPPLPGLEELLQYRGQLSAKISTGEMSPAQARASLSAREAEMLERWRELAAQNAARQRQVEQAQSDYERAYREQLRIEQGSGIRNLPNR